MDDPAEAPKGSPCVSEFLARRMAPHIFCASGGCAGDTMCFYGLPEWRQELMIQAVKEALLMAENEAEPRETAAPPPTLKG